jgi:GNAT superfamily N-acetyltransferase
MSSRPSDSFTVRAATVADAETLVAHRRAMFFDIGYQDREALDGMAERFRDWVRPRLESGEYRAWLAVTPDGVVAAGAALWLMDWPPMPFAVGSPRGNIFNVYTRPESRRRGLARRLMETILDWCRANHVKIVILHTSDEGRALYESLGFKRTREMRLELGPPQYHPGER